MQGVVPAAGEGTRLRPLTDDRPKGLVEVAGKPLLTHVFETLADLGVESIVVVVGYRGDAIREYYDSSFEGIPLNYATQDERLGLAHAVLQAEPHVEGEFLLLNGDNVFDADLSPVVERHRATDADATTLVERVPRERARAGGVFDVADGEVVGLVEKPDEPPSRLIPRGVYAFSPAILPACRLVTPGHTGEYELSDAVDLLIQAGRRVETVEFDGWCRNVNTPADREQVAAHFESS
ncbi:sugar phosphate nucleotidyltransferase [Salinibaculum rarum]|uniref:sugar phosphate nucleotidyltransferase n=1 Tax=Salinibaculum rarum TaxID=3058903 RepID=UPI00265FF866|nr:sugar phosphate nucleotidyltransferase [Salinibaculum sp. KK48]